MGRKIGTQQNAVFSTSPADASPRWDQLGTFQTGQFLTQSPSGDLTWATPATGGSGVSGTFFAFGTTGVPI